MMHGTEIWAYLDRDGNAYGPLHGFQDVDITMLDLASRHFGAGRNKINVELKRGGTSLFHFSGIAEPAASGSPVKARHKRDIDGPGGMMKHFQVRSRIDTVRPPRGKIG